MRTPGNHPLGPAAAAGGPAMFGGDGFTEDFATTRLPAIGGDGGSAGTGPVPSTSPAAADNGIGGSGGEVAIPPAVS